MKESDSSSLLSPGEATLEVLHPVTGFSVQDTHGATAASPTKGHKQ